MNGKRVLVFVLCLILILTASVIPTVLAAGSSVVNVDYSRPSSYFNTVFTASDLVEYLGYEVSDGERAYLDAYGGVNFKYETVTAQQISVVTSDSTTRVIARPYTYVGVAGEVTWIPVSVSLDSYDGVFVIDDEGYIADFDGAIVDENSSVSVGYKLDIGNAFTVACDDVNIILNLAYDNAPAIKAEVESARAEYNAAKDAYDTFCSEHADEIEKYHSDMILYEQYLSDKLVYDEKYQEYVSYLEKYAAYEAQVLLYEAYLEELEEYYLIKDHNDSYADKYAKYLIDKSKYEDYLSKMELIREHIAILDDGLMTKATYLKRQLYSSLYSSLVDDVIAANKEIYITMLGIDAQVIDDCADASNDIRAILTPKRGVTYKDLKTEEEKYDFYVNNRDELCDAIIKLTRALHELYSNDRLREMMHNAPALVGKADYTEKLSIFISQLILFSNALSDEPVLSFDGSFVLDGNVKLKYWKSDGTEVKGRSVIDILEGNAFVTDNGNAAPIPGGYPTVVSEPTAPELLPEMDKPDEVAEPVEPNAVTDPGDAPDVVKEPSLPEGMPDEPIKPDIIDNTAYLGLISAFDLGLLEKRNEVDYDVVYTPTVTLTKKVISTDMVHVTFVDSDGGVITEISVDRGTSANFIGDLPTKAEDISATYDFVEWVTEDGEAYDLSAVGEDVTLYPYFTPNYKEYEVDATSGYLGVFVSGEDLSYIPLSHFIDVAKENRYGLLFSGDNVALRISYSGVLNISDAGVAFLNISAGEAELGGYTCEISAYTEQGTVSEPVSDITVLLPVSDAQYAKDSVLTYTDSKGELFDAYKSYESSVVNFRVTTGLAYSLTLLPAKYSIDTSSSSLGGRVSAPSHAFPGDTVVLDVDLPEGMEAEISYYLLTDSTKHTIVGNSFVMPSGNVKLIASFSDVLYTVRFVNDGKEISSKTYKYGDTVRIPNDPIKLSDNEYSYNFIGWSSEITVVTGDATYAAQYEKIPLPEEESKFPWFTVIYYSVISLGVLIVVTVVLLILNKKGIISIKGIFSAVKRKLSRVGGKCAPESVTENPDDAKTEQTHE